MCNICKNACTSTYSDSEQWLRYIIRAFAYFFCVNMALRFQKMYLDLNIFFHFEMERYKNNKE